MAGEFDYQEFEIDSLQFEIPSRYVPNKVIGSGAYGHVASAEDTATGNSCAIKKVSNAFSEPTDMKRCLREIIVLSKFDHENIINLFDLWANSPNGKQELQDIYLVTNLMETDLSRIIRSKQPLMPEHIQYFVYQTLRGLKYIHSAKIIHRDLKPSNLLVNRNCDLRICDLGLARTVNEADASAKKKDMLTEYVVTRWYRAPEVMLSSHEYGTPLDLWAVGCVFAELFLKKALFPGHDYIDQCSRIIKFLGTPSEEDSQFITNEKARSFVFSLPKSSGEDLSAYFPNISSEAQNMISQLLKLNPKSRITTEKALAHPYMLALHDEADEPTCPNEFDFGYEREFSKVGEARTQKYREAALKEIVKFRPEFGKPYKDMYLSSGAGKEEEDDKEWEFGDKEEAFESEGHEMVQSMSVYGNDDTGTGPQLEQAIKKK